MEFSFSHERFNSICKMFGFEQDFLTVKLQFPPEIFINATVLQTPGCYTLVGKMQ